MGQACSVEQAKLAQQLPLPPAVAAACGLEALGDKDGQNVWKIPDLNNTDFGNKYIQGSVLAPKVSQVKHRLSRAFFVTYRLAKDTLPNREATEISQRIKSLQSMEHHNICQLEEAFDNGPNLFLVYEQLLGKILLTALGKMPDVTEPLVAQIFLQAVRALTVASVKGFCHGALAPKNLFLDSEHKLIMTDLGLANMLKPHPLDSKNKEAFECMAPEILVSWLERDGAGGQKKAPKAKAKGKDKDKEKDVQLPVLDSRGDVWSLGVVLFTVLCGSMPFKGKTQRELATNIVETDWSFPEEDSPTEDARSVITQMLQKDPKKRITLQALLKQPWFKDEDNDDDENKAATMMDTGVLEGFTTLQEELHFKQLMMRMIAERIPAAKKKELTVGFELLDVDNLGSLTLAELKEGMEQHPDLFGSLAEANFDEIFDAIDHNKSGDISLQEFLAVTIDSQKDLIRTELWELFRSLDLDGDGKLTFKEISKAVKMFEGNRGSEYMVILLENIELEVPQPITFLEFKELVLGEGGRASDSEAPLWLQMQRMYRKFMQDCREGTLFKPEIIVDTKAGKAEKGEKSDGEEGEGTPKAGRKSVKKAGKKSVKSMTPGSEAGDEDVKDESEGANKPAAKRKSIKKSAA